MYRINIHVSDTIQFPTPRFTLVLLLALLLCLLVHGLAKAQGNNRKPRIVGQDPVVTNEDEAFTVLMTYLRVDDPDDWFYPWGFTMTIHPGDHYTFQGHVVTPAENFHGKLRVRVTVNDGVDESNMFNLDVTVNPVNDKPVIRGHSSLSINEGQSLNIQLHHLDVIDPDNDNPRDFSVEVHNGNSYSVNGNQITPAPGFTGNLSVQVSVNDGAASSDIYTLPVTVQAINRAPLIVGQSALQVREDESITVQFDHLVVTDEDSNYPDGFTISIQPGKHYAVSGNTVTPSQDFFGPLTVRVTVNDGEHTSKPFDLLIQVTPVNDAPVLSDIESDPLHYNATTTALTLTETLTVREVDGDSIVLAEIRFDPGAYRPEIDQLLYEPAAGSAIRGVFDRNAGVLTLIGGASPERYMAALRSVRYACLLPTTHTSKTLSFTASDGKATSEAVTREIVFGQVSIALDIPTGFTPNGDMANDTWKIIPLKEEEAYAKARIRVYNKEGILVYESTGFENEWDGRYEGEPLPADTYFYTIDLNINAPEGYLKGLVTILR